MEARQASLAGLLQRNPCAVIMVSVDVLAKPVLRADHRIAYGTDSSQFGDLWMPRVPAGHKAPVVIFFHGGWWKSEYDLGYAGYLCRALRDSGIACWSVEYRRVGATGGGWPATFQDAAAGLDFVAKLADRFPLDTHRVITVGHSAGGHLAFWNAGRHHLPSGSPFAAPPAIALRGAISLAGAIDLQELIARSGNGLFAHDRHEVVALMGSGPAEHPERYRAGDPGQLLPLEGTQVLLQGTLDDQIPPTFPEQWAAKARRVGATVRVHMLPDADHFDIVDPESRAWPPVLAEVKLLLA